MTEQIQRTELAMDVVETRRYQIYDPAVSKDQPTLDTIVRFKKGQEILVLDHVARVFGGWDERARETLYRFLLVGDDCLMPLSSSNPSSKGIYLKIVNTEQD